MREQGPQPLLDRGRIKHQRDVEGEPPLHLRVHHRQEEVVLALEVEYTAPVVYPASSPISSGDAP